MERSSSLMSLHRISEKGINPEVWVGWDPPLGTFFVDVLEVGGACGEVAVYSVGNRPGEVTDARELRRLLRPFLSVRWDIVRLLVADQCLDR